MAGGRANCQHSPRPEWSSPWRPAISWICRAKGRAAKAKVRSPPRIGGFVGVQFACCDVYTRVYINRDETAYEGRCPKCGKKVRLAIGPGGTDSRFFTAR